MNKPKQKIFIQAKAYLGMVTRDELLELLATDFNKFIYDDFNYIQNWRLFSAPGLTFAKTGSAEEDIKLLQMRMNTGIQANSTLFGYYNYNIFNPMYGKAYFHLQLSSMKNIFVFFGFKETLDLPTSAMTEKHIGIMVENNKMYLSSSDGTTQQKVEIVGLDMTRDNIYRIENDKLYTYPFPYYSPYLDNVRLITPDRIWTMRQQNSTYPPDDTAYYCCFFIKNLTGADAYINVKKFIYGEEYAD